METFSEDAELVGGLRQLVWERGEWRSTVVPGKEAEGVKFSDYFSATERVKSVPSHRVLALLRGRKEGILRLAVVLPDEEGAAGPTEPERRIAGRAGIEQQGPAGRRLARRDRALDVEGQAARAPRDRDRAAAARAGRGRSHPRVRPQPARPAAGRAGRTARRRWDSIPGFAPASRSPSSTAPARCSTRRPSIRTSRARTGTARCARSAALCRAARRAAHLDRQRHRVARDRRARRRSDHAASGAAR